MRFRTCSIPPRHRMIQRARIVLKSPLVYTRDLKMQLARDELHQLVRQKLQKIACVKEPFNSIKTGFLFVVNQQIKVFVFFF